MAGMQANIMLEKEIAVLFLEPKAARKRLSSRELIGDSLQHWVELQSPPPQWCTSSKKVTPANSATP